MVWSWIYVKRVYIVVKEAFSSRISILSFYDFFFQQHIKLFIKIFLTFFYLFVL